MVAQSAPTEFRTHVAGERNAPSGHTDNNDFFTSATVSDGSHSIVTVRPSRFANKNRNVTLAGSNLYGGRVFLELDTTGADDGRRVATATGGAVVVGDVVPFASRVPVSLSISTADSAAAAGSLVVAWLSLRSTPPPLPPSRRDDGSSSSLVGSSCSGDDSSPSTRSALAVDDVVGTTTTTVEESDPAVAGGGSDTEAGADCDSTAAASVVALVLVDSPVGGAAAVGTETASAINGLFSCQERASGSLKRSERLRWLQAGATS